MGSRRAADSEDSEQQVEKSREREPIARAPQAVEESRE
jgi:hypothetical protein